MCVAPRFETTVECAAKTFVVAYTPIEVSKAAELKRVSGKTLNNPVDRILR